MDLGLRGRVALIGGSSRGIGSAIAEAMAAEGADVALCARGTADLERAAALVASRGARVVHRAADLANAEDAIAVGEWAADQLGRLDVLIVNAGGPPPGTFAQLDEQGWRTAYDLTLMSAVRMVRGALPVLRRSDAASILFVSSFSVRHPIPTLVLSNSVRAAVAGLAKSLADELAPAVRVNTLLPGNIKTERALAVARRQAVNGRTVEEVISEQSKSIPLGRYGEPAELARVAVFISSPAASYITGAVITCDGGLIRPPL